MSEEDKKRFCSTGSHWTSEKFVKIGPVRWICMRCYQKRQAELRNLPKNRRLAATHVAKPTDSAASTAKTPTSTSK